MTSPTAQSSLRHAVLGVGGVGGLLAALLSRVGENVSLILREQSLAEYRGTLTVTSQLFGSFTQVIPATGRLQETPDVLWVTPKATQLAEFLALAPSAVVGDAVVVPLLNGVDHVATLRRDYRRVVPAAIRVEVERLTGMRIEHRSPFIRIDLPESTASSSLAGILERSGITCSVAGDENTVLWQKLCFLAPLALVTAAGGRPIGARAEVVSLARLAGVEIDRAALRRAHERLPPAFTSSMQTDIGRGRTPELDAITKPLLRVAAEHRESASAISELARRIRQISLEGEHESA